MTQITTTTALDINTLGLDLGDKQSVFCKLAGDGTVIERGSVATTRESLVRMFEGIERSRVVVEVCGQSAWISRVAEQAGHEVIVANSRRVELINRNQRKTDRNDAELLARLGRSDPKLLSPIVHRSAVVLADRELLGARHSLVDVRTKLVNHVRQVVKVQGYRILKCSTESFHKSAPEQLPEQLQDTLSPMIRVIGSVSEQIRSYDKQIERVCMHRYPVTKILRQVDSVGYVTSLAYVLTIEDPARFRRSRQVGPYLGMVPGSFQSSETNPELRITKAGDREMRRLLIIAANYIMGRGPDCDLRRFGEKLAARGGKKARQRAKVAVARKLAVLLHRLWVTGEVYDPFRQAKRNGETIPD